jgi:FMN reductase
VSEIVLISGSPSATSRTTAILKDIRRRLTSLGFEATLIVVRDLPGEDLLAARYDSATLQPSIELVAKARALVVGTPVYQAAYSGVLKTFLDILPQSALRGKTVLPIATGGSPAHLLAIDYSLKPVLSALGATDLLQGVYIVDQQLTLTGDGELGFADPELRARLREAITHFLAKVKSGVTV